MKTKIGILLASLFLVLCTATIHAQIVVKVKPVAPRHINKPASPGANFIWIDGHWKWNKHQNQYVWVDGHWIKEKRGHVWIPGHWKDVPNGHKWIPGHWSRRKM